MAVVKAVNMDTVYRTGFVTDSANSNLLDKYLSKYQSMLDIVSERSQIYVSTIGFKGGTVIDGTGAPPSSVEAI